MLNRNQINFCLDFNKLMKRYAVHEINTNFIDFISNGIKFSANGFDYKTGLQILDEGKVVNTATQCGEWLIATEENPSGEKYTLTECSVCGYQMNNKMFFEPWNFKRCPNCAAYMVHDEDEIVRKYEVKL